MGLPGPLPLSSNKVVPIIMVLGGLLSLTVFLPLGFFS